MLLTLTDPSDGDPRQFRSVREIHLFFDLYSVCINRLYANLESIGNFTSRVEGRVRNHPAGAGACHQGLKTLNNSTSLSMFFIYCRPSVAREYSSP
jgi:hypothetical protein